MTRIGLPTTTFTFPISCLCRETDTMFVFGAEIFRDQFNERRTTRMDRSPFLSFPDFLVGMPGEPISAGGNGTPLSNVSPTWSLLRSRTSHCARRRPIFLRSTIGRYRRHSLSVQGCVSRPTASRAKPMGGSAASTRSSMFRHRPMALQTPPPPDSCWRTITKGLRRRGFRAAMPRFSMTRFSGIPSRASAWRGGPCHRAISSSEVAMDCTPTASASLEPAAFLLLIPPSRSRRL